MERRKFTREFKLEAVRQHDLFSADPARHTGGEPCHIG
jgi:hypothetical protein